MEFLFQLFPTHLLAQAGGSQFSGFISILVILVLAISIHEFCHAKFADMAGDPTPGIYGRVTLNPVSHFDPIGAIMLLVMAWSGFGFGWGKPVPIDPNKMRNPRTDYFVAVAAGPISNLLQAVIFGLLFRVGMSAGALQTSPELFHFLVMGVIINLVLFAFNLIPLGPLDGRHLVGLLLPDRVADKWNLFHNTTGNMIFIFLLLFGVFSPMSPLSTVVLPVVEALSRPILGT